MFTFVESGGGGLIGGHRITFCGVILSQPLCAGTITYFAQQPQSPIMLIQQWKSIVILRIPKYKLLSYTNMPINITEEYPETFSDPKILKCATKSDHERLWYSFQMPCGICKWIYEKNENSFCWWGWLPSVRRTSVISISTNLETWIKCLLLWKVEEGGL